MNILIVQTKKTALNVAAAYDGLRQGDHLKLTAAEIADDINSAMSNVRGEKFISVIEGEETTVMWSSDAHVNFARPPLLTPVQLPYLTGTEYTISGRWKEAIDRVLEGAEVRKIIIALLPSMRTALFHYLLPAAYPDKEIAITRLDSLEAKDIRNAIKSASYDAASVKDGFDKALARKHITDLVRANITSAMKHYKEQKGGVDQYILTALFLIAGRTHNDGKERFVINANFQLNGQPLHAVSDMGFTHAEGAEVLQTLLGKPLSAASRIKPSLPTTATLFSLYDGEEYAVSEMQRIAISLYEKGFITCPYTMNKKLPPGTDDERIETLRTICRCYDSAIDEAFDYAQNNLTTETNRSTPGCILPLKTDTSALTIREEALYEHLIRSVLADINRLGSDVYYRFRVEDSPVTFKANTKSMTLGRTGKVLDCNYELVQDGTFKIYEVGELIDELASYGLGTAEMLVTIIDRMSTMNLITTSERGISLSEQGEEYCSAYPLDAFRTPQLCAYWDWALRPSKDKKPDSDKVLESVKSMVSDWIGVFRGERPAVKTHVPKPPVTKEETESRPAPTAEPPKPPAPPKKKSEPPKPEVPARTEAEKTQKPEKPAEPPKPQEPKKTTITEEGMIYEITPDDFKALKKNGHIGPKFGKSQEGKVGGAKYFFLDENGEITASDKTIFTCPHCGGDINVYMWGYACTECSFYVPFYMYGTVFKPGIIRQLMEGRKTDMIDGLKKKDGTTFSARISIDRNGKVHFFHE